MVSWQGARARAGRLTAVARALRILVLGYYGCGNAGDELVLSGIQAGIASEAGGRSYEVRALTGDPADTAQLHSIRGYRRFSPAQALAALRWCDCLVLGGGSLLQDSTSRRSAAYYLWMMRLALMMRRKLFVWAQGFGPLSDRRLRSSAASVLSRACGVTVRDEPSLRDLVDVGVSPALVRLSADPAFLVRPAPTYPNRQQVQAEATGVALRQWPGAASHIAAAVEALSEFSRQTGGRLLFIAFQHPQDEQLASEAARSSGSDAFAANVTPSEMMRLFSEIRMTVAVRLHALILAAAAGVPFVGVSYDPKVERFCRASGMPWLPLEGLTAGELLDILLSVNEHRSEAAEKLEVFRREQMGLAKQSAELFWETVTS